MSKKLTDPLLIAAKVITIMAQILTILAMVLLGIGIAVVLTVGRAEVLAEMGKAGVPDYGTWLIAAAMLTGMGLMWLGQRFFSELRGIIDSVGDGDPFHPENADRLSRMGWISVAAQVLLLPIGAMALWFASYADKVDKELHVGGGLDGGGILLTLILFILARVFREGTRMREELEGTV